MYKYTLQDKVIVVTGGAGKIGQEFVRRISEEGGVAVVADINLSAAKLASDRYPNKVDLEFLDINEIESIHTLIKNLEERYGRIDALVNNAYPRNLNFGRRLEEVTYKDFCENVNLHLCGYFLIMQQFSMVFKRQGYGNIVNMSSIYGSKAPFFEIYNGTPMTMPVEYAAIKAGVENLTRYFAQYYKGVGIRINSLSPGGISAGQPTSFLEAYKSHCASKGMLEPKDLLGALIFLLSDDSKFMNGQNLIVDDGFSL